MIVNDRSPYYVKLGYKFLVIFFLCYFIHVARGILIPFSFAVLLSFLLLPIASYLESKKLSRSLSIGIALIIATSIIISVIYFLSRQIANFADDIPSLKQHMQLHFEAFQKWIVSTFHVSFREQNAYLNNAAEKIKNSGTGYLGSTFLSVTETIMLMILLPIYTFLILYYRDLIRAFLYGVFPKAQSEKVTIVVRESKTMIHNYIVGLMIEMAIVAVANSFGLMMLGVKYAIFFGVLAAVLNIIPFIGMFTAVLFTVLVTLTTSTHTSDVIWVVVIMYSIHIIDVNILMPKIVASKLRINALMSILGVVIGGALTGVAGLFLSVPAIALVKIICDEVDDLKPWGALLGDDISRTRQSKLVHHIKKLRIKNKSIRE